MFTFWNRKHVAVAAIILLQSPVPLFAQKVFFTLSDLTDSADHYLPRLLEKKALVNSATANVTDVRHLFLPSLRASDQVNLGTDNSLAGSYFPFGIVPSTSSGVRASNDYQAASGNVAILYGEYDLVNFGYKSASINNAKSLVSFQYADLQREIYILNGDLGRAYFNLLKNEARLEVEKQTVLRYDTIFKVIRTLTQSGIKPGSDSSLARAELSKSRITYNQITEAVKNYQEQIAYLTGISAERIITDTSLLSRDLSHMVPRHKARVENPLIGYYENLRNTYTANERLISKSYLPKIYLTASTWARGSSISYDDQYKSLPEGWGLQRFNYMAGISFEYDLFNGIHKNDRLRTYGFERQAAELELEQQTLELSSRSQQAQNSIDITEKNLLELPVQYQSAVDTYNQKIAQYKAGIISLIDLTNAAFVLDRSLNDYVETTGDWYQAQLDKAIADGTLTGFIQSIR
jgi:outer membrane protein TolC